MISQLHYSERLQSLTNLDEQISFLENIINQNLIDKINQKEIINQIERIKKRSLDQNFYLAIVGEFSSGKSTFINALLRDELLKTSALVATACATKIKYEKDLLIEVSIKGKKKGILKVNKTSSSISVPWLKINEVPPRSLIHLLTAEDHIARNVLDLTIYHPAKFLKEGITIIDTPGTNAINIEHGKITRNVIENEADVAVVIIPASTPLSQSLANFLNNSLHSFLHHCIFIVTKIDTIRKKERGSFLNNLRQRLNAMLNIENPTLLSVSAQAILDGITETEDRKDDYLFWERIFSHSENFILNKLRKNRIILIAENILRLLNQTLEKIEENLNHKSQNYQEYELALKTQTIQDLATFTLNKKKKSREKIKQALEKVQEKIEYITSEYQQQKKEEIRKKILAVGDWDELKSVTENGAESILKSGEKVLQEKLNKKVKELNNIAEQVQSSFDQDFANAYQKLQALGATFDLSDKLNSDSSSLNTNKVFSDFKNLQAKQEDDAANRVIAGAIVGAVGAILIPGIGAFLGGILGASLSRLFAPSLEERKNELWDHLEPHLNNYFKQLKQTIEEDVKMKGKKLIENLENRIDLYMKTYNDVVDIMLSEQKKQLEELHDLQTSTQTYLKEIERRKIQIKEQIKRLLHSD